MYRTSALRFAFAGMLIIIGGFFAAASAQAELGRISGTVTDMNGALIAGAAVSATNRNLQILQFEQIVPAGMPRLESRS